MSGGLRPREVGADMLQCMLCREGPCWLFWTLREHSPGCSTHWMLGQARWQEGHDVFSAWGFGTLTQTPIPIPSQTHAAHSLHQHYLSAHHMPPTPRLCRHTHLHSCAATPLAPSHTLTRTLTHAQPTAGSPPFYWEVMVAGLAGLRMNEGFGAWAQM